MSKKPDFEYISTLSRANSLPSASQRIAVNVVQPLFFAIIVVMSPLIYLFNSTFLVNDLGATDSIREIFLLFRKGYFWSTIGKLAAISGISILVGMILMIFQFIPVIGFIIALVGQN